MDSGEYHDRCLQCMSAIDGHAAAMQAARSAKHLCGFNLTVETLIIGGSAYVGLRSYHVANLEASFVRAITGNHVMLRIFNPVPFTMFTVAGLTGLFTIWDFGRYGQLRRMEGMQRVTVLRATEEFSRLKASRNTVN